MILVGKYRFNPNPCDGNTNENHNLDNTTLASKIQDKINDYTSAFNVTITFTIDDKIQVYAGFVYKYSFSDGTNTWKGAKFIPCTMDPVTKLYNIVVRRLKKLGVINTTGTVNITDTDTADYSIEQVIPSDDGYLAKITVTYNNQTVTIAYVSDDLSKPDNDLREAVLMALVNAGLLTEFDVTVGYEVVEQ